MKHYIVIVLFLLSGCATKGATPPTATTIAVEARSYDEVWNASMAVIRNEGLTIVKSNRNTGELKAKHRYPASSEKEIVGVFISPPTNSDIYTIEVRTLKGSRPNSTNWDYIAVGLKKALSSTPQTYGTIGLVSARFVPVIELIELIELNEVSTGRAQGSVKGAKKGAAMGATPGAVLMYGGLFCPDPFCAGVFFVGGAGVAVVGAVVGTVVGGVAGAVKADSAETVHEQGEQAKAVLAGLKIQETVRDRVEQYANKQGRPMFITFSDAGPTSPDEEANYQSLAPQKIDTVLEITVTSLGMQTDDKYKSDINPSLAVFINAGARLVQTKNNIVLQDRPYVFESEARTLSEWNAENGRLAAESLTQGYQQISEQIYYSFF